MPRRVLLVLPVALLLACGGRGGACSLKGVTACEGDDVVWCDGDRWQVYCSCGEAGATCEGDLASGYACTDAVGCPCPGEGC